MICRIPFTACIYYRDYLHQQRLFGGNVQVMNQVKQKIPKILKFCDWKRITFFQADGLYSTLWFISKYLIFLNAGINPVVYGSTNEKFRQAFKNMKFYGWLFPLSIKNNNRNLQSRLKKQTKSSREKLKKSSSNAKKIEIVDNPTGAENSQINLALHI